MMRHFDTKRYPRERGKKFIHYFGEAIIQGGRLFERGYYSRRYGNSHTDSHSILALVAKRHSGQMLTTLFL